MVFGGYKGKCLNAGWGILVETPDASFCLLMRRGRRGRGGARVSVDACVRGRTSKRRCLRRDAQHRERTKRSTQPAQAGQVHQGVKEGVQGFPSLVAFREATKEKTLQLWAAFATSAPDGVDLQDVVVAIVKVVDVTPRL